MTHAQHFALVVLLVAAVGLVAVLSSRLTERLRIPPPERGDSAGWMYRHATFVYCDLIQRAHGADEAALDRVRLQ